MFEKKEEKKAPEAKAPEAPVAAEPKPGAEAKAAAASGLKVFKVIAPCYRHGRYYRPGDLIKALPDEKSAAFADVESGEPVLKPEPKRRDGADARAEAAAAKKLGARASDRDVA